MNPYLALGPTKTFFFFFFFFLIKKKKTQKSPRMPHGENVRNGLNEAMLGLPPTEMMGRGDQVPGTDHDNRQLSSSIFGFTFMYMCAYFIY